MRLLITGVPRSGKTTLGLKLARHLQFPLVRTDEYIRDGWDVQKQRSLDAVQGKSAVVVEGVAAARLLRHWRPDYIVVCERSQLADPSHKGMAGLVEKRLSEYTSVPRVHIWNAHKTEPEEVLRRIEILKGSK